MSNVRLVDTPFRSPQWTLFDLGPNDWLLYLRLPEYAPHRRRRRVQEPAQLALFEEMLKDSTRGGVSLPRLRLVSQESHGQEVEE